MRARSRGLSLVELMVAVTLAIVTSVVVLQVLSVYEARKRTATGANDAEIGGAVGLFRLEREVRMAGAGMTLPANMACQGGLNLFYDHPINGPTTESDGAAFAPLRIFDGGAAGGLRAPPDRIRVMRSDAAFGVAPAAIIQGMAAPSSDIVVNSALGLVQGDLLLVGGPDGAETCTIVQLSDDPDATGNGFRLEHGAAFPYNPLDPDAVFTDAVSYDVGDIAVNLGRLALRTFGVVCNDAGVPGAANSCDLAEWDALTALANPPALADVASISPQVVDLQMQYGVAAAGSQVVNAWVDATGATWAAPTAANLARIKAVRIALVTRGNLEREQVSPATLELFPAITAGPANPTAAVSMALADAERFYRYKVLHVVVPLVNVIWAGV